MELPVLLVSRYGRISIAHLLRSCAANRTPLARSKILQTYLESEQ